MMHPAAAQRLLERLGDVFLALDLGESGGAVTPVQGKRCVGHSRADLTLMARVAVRSGNVACHDLIRAVEGGGDPSHTRQSPRTLAAFRPWGSWRDARHARGLPSSLVRPTDSGNGYGSCSRAPWRVDQALSQRSIWFCAAP